MSTLKDLAEKHGIPYSTLKARVNRYGWSLEKALETPVGANKTHGLSGSRAFNNWLKMRSRCEDPKNNRYDLYGGRGIKVCDRWKDFAKFYEDMGDPPAGKTLDRKDPDGDYEPENCRWASGKDQQRNRRNNVTLAFQGRTQCLEAWAEEVGIRALTIRARIKDYGWTVEHALTTPVK